MIGRWAVLLLTTVLFWAAGCQPAPHPDERPPSHKVTRPVEEVPAPPPPPPVTWQDRDRAVKMMVSDRREEAAALLTRLQNELTLTPEQARSVNFLTAVNAYERGRFDRTSALLAEPASVPPGLTDIALYYRGMAAFNTGDYPAARSLLGEYLGAAPYGVLVEPARLAHIEALALAGRPMEALGEARRRLKNDPKNGGVMLVMARIHQLKGENGSARKYYQRAMEHSRVRAVRAEAAEGYRRMLYPVADRPGHEELKLDLVKFLKKEWRLEETLSLIDRFQAEPGSQRFKDQLASLEARLLFLSGRLDQALPYYRDRARSGAYGKWMYARTLERLGRWPEAAEAYEAAGRAYGGTRRGNHSHFEAGLCYLRMGREAEAKAAWNHMTGAYRRGRYRDDMLWRLGLYHAINQQWPQAAETFQKLLDQVPKSDFRRGATYWRGVALENMGQTGAAAGVYRSLAASSSDYYYRMLAQQRLGTVGRTDHWDDLPMFRHLLQSAVDADELTVGAGHEAWALSDPGLGLDHLLEERKKIIYQPELTQGSAELNITLRRLKTLAAVGAMDLAFLEADRLAEIASRTRRAAGGRSMSSDERRQFEAELDALRGRLFAFRSAYLAEAQVYDRFVRLQYSYRKTLYTGAAREDKGVARRRFLPLCYPAELLDASRTHHLHPALILAIMRNESLYQADILSGANARGLMQVLPSTAAKICRRTGQTTPDYDQLFEPAVNIELAAWYISALIEEFDGQLPLALASYNAGPFNVKRWVRQAPNISMELFVETIPFEQTNQYVKKILGTFYEYRMHYAGVKSMPDLSPAVRSQFLDAVNF